MLDLLRTIDRLLRGRFTSAETLRRGRLELPLWKLAVLGVALGASYGLFMGLYAAMRPESPTALQLLVSACKVPVLFLLTLVVTLPSLYVCSALAGSRLGLPTQFFRADAWTNAYVAVSRLLGRIVGPW